MNPELLFMCKIADADAKARIEKYAIVTEIESDDIEDILANIAGKDGVVVPYTAHMLVTKEVIDQGVSLKLIGSTYGGTRQNIEDIYALEKDLTVIHTGASRPRPMAEYTLALTLSSLLQIHNYNMYMRNSEPWPRFKYGRTRILQNRKIGVVGFGQIGQAIVDIFKCFSDDISVRSGHLTEEKASVMGVKKRELNEIFTECDIIVLAGGYTPKTHQMIGKEQFDLMQDNALFVNIARGKMVDQKAMIKAVENKGIYLALDVFENEPLEDDSPLRENDRILITPHRANNSIEFEERWQCLADEIERFYTGKKPESALTAERARNMSES
jgi:phosphoglycerate dehydrogenase-like enzyme